MQRLEEIMAGIMMIGSTVIAVAVAFVGMFFSDIYENLPSDTAKMRLYENEYSRGI